MIPSSSLAQVLHFYGFALALALALFSHKFMRNEFL
ncbi:hypothetical protein A2U01_0060377, partial [Trifolium medium]|nr:hypothetical protein [Trifolium medium]